MGLWFHDATGIFAGEWPRSERGQGTWQDVDVDLAPRSNNRWTYDFGVVRFRHGLGYRPWVLLATGETIEGAAGVAREEGLRIAGLGVWTLPLPPLEGGSE